MYSVGSGMVLAIGDLAGATVVTLLAPRRVCPSGVAIGDRDRSCRDRRGDRAALRAMGMSNPVPVGSPRKSAAIIPFVTNRSPAGFLLGRLGIA
jgi:hypothetical protein